MTLDDSIRLYHTVYPKTEGEDLVRKSLDICKNGLEIQDYDENNLRSWFLFFNDTPQDIMYPLVILQRPKKLIFVADITDKSDSWSSTIVQYDIWEKDKFQIPFPEFLIGATVPIEHIVGVLYEGREYSRTDFIEQFTPEKSR